MRYDRILDAVARGEVDAGLIIHESRFTYADHGLVEVADLGEWWETETGLPIPLGAICARTDVGPELIAEAETAIRLSVEHAFAHPLDSLEYVRAHAQELSDEVCRQHIELYVNEFTRRPRRRRPGRGRRAARPRLRPPRERHRGPARRDRTAALPGLGRRRRRERPYAGRRRRPRAGAARRRADVVRQPDPAQRDRARVLPVADGPARDAGLRVPARRAHARRGRLRGRDRRRRARRRAARARRRGGRRGPRGRRPHRRAGGRVRHRGRRPELHGHRDARAASRSWLGTVNGPESFLPGHVACVAHSGSIAEAFQAGRAARRLPHRRLGGRRAVARPRRLRRVPGRRRGHAGDRALRRDDPAPRGLRRRARAGRRGGQARGLPEGRALAGRRARGARALRRGRRARRARSPRCCATTARSRWATSTSCSRRSRCSGATAGRAGGASPESPSRAASAACSPTTARRPASPSRPSVTRSRRRLVEAFPNYTLPENPLDCWAIDDAEIVYPGQPRAAARHRRLRRAARAGRPLASTAARTTRSWCSRSSSRWPTQSRARRSSRP